MSEQPSDAGDREGATAPPSADPSSPTAPTPSSPAASDPEDWRSTAAPGDDERYLRERPPHWE